MTSSLDRDLGNVTLLSQVSFPSASPSLRIGEEGTRIARTRFDALCSKSSVAFVLTKEQLGHYTAARKFLEQRYGKLGVLFPETGPAFVYDRRFTDTSGICDSLLRAPGVLYSTGKTLDKSAYESSWVHELTHASGSVRWGVAPSPDDSSARVFTISRAGWLMRLGGKNALFSALEEYAATVNQCLYLSEQSGFTSNISDHEVNLRLKMDRELSVRTFRLCTQIFEPERFAEIERCGSVRRWERAFLDEGGMCSVRVPRQNWLSNGVDTNIHVYEILPLLNEFAEELLPHISKEQAIQKFQEMVLKAHVNGDLAPVLRAIKDRLGRETIRFLANWGPKEGDVLTQNDIALLSLFVRAGRLGGESARLYRAELVSVLAERKGAIQRVEYAPLVVEALLIDAQSGKWSSWLEEGRREVVAQDSELRAKATESCLEAFAAGRLSEAAEICIAGALDSTILPSVPSSTVREVATELLTSGEIQRYQDVVAVFSPHEPVVTKEQERELIAAAALDKLRSRRIGEFAAIARSPLCERSMLVTDEVEELATQLLYKIKAFNFKLTLFSALPKEIQERIPQELFPRD